MIDLQEIAAGDEVALRDRSGFIVRGEVHDSSDKLSVTAFETSIQFARLSRKRWMPIPGVTVFEHQPSLIDA